MSVCDHRLYLWCDCRARQTCRLTTNFAMRTFHVRRLSIAVVAVFLVLLPVAVLCAGKCDLLLRVKLWIVLFVQFSNLPQNGHCLSVFSVTLLSFLVPLSPEITENPVSVTSHGGARAVFHCAGIGINLDWIVDDNYLYHQSNQHRGITTVTLPSSSGTVQSNLTVPATSANNGTTVRCAIGVSQFILTAISNYSTLTVLPGEWAVCNSKQ